MTIRKLPEREIVYSLEDVPDFASEDEEREWWAMHDLAEELGTDVTEEHHALIKRLKSKYHYTPVRGRKSKGGKFKQGYHR